METTIPNAVDWTTVMLALIAMIGTALTAFLSYLTASRQASMKQTLDHQSEKVDGIVTSLVQTTEAKGVAEGKVDVLERVVPTKPPNTYDT
jgi:hypothetical protein